MKQGPRRSSADKRVTTSALLKQVRQQQREIAALKRAAKKQDAALTEALEQQTATAEILRVISSSPTDVQPVFDTIARSATRLCGAVSGAVFRFDGELIHLVADHNLGGDELDVVWSAFPTPPGRGSATGRAILSRAIAHVEDLIQDPEYAIAHPGYRTILSVPMLREGLPIGAITVARREVAPFSADQIELLKTFARQAVIAIENVRLFKELEARNRDLTEALEQQTATSEILRVISSSPTDVQPVFDAIVTTGTRLCGASYGFLVRYDGRLMTLSAQHNATNEEMDTVLQLYPRPAGPDSLGGRTILGRAVVHVPDVSSDPTYGLRVIQDAGWRTFLGVPLLRGGTAIGALGMWRREVRPFSDRQVALLQTFADQAVIAIENVRLFTELQHKNEALTQAHAQVTEALEQQTATAEILQIISRTQADPQPVFETIVRNAVRLCDAVYGHLYRFDGEMFHFVAQDGLPPEDLEQWRRTFPRRLSDGGGLRQVVLTGSVLNLADVKADSSIITPAAREAARVWNVASWLFVPMLRQTHVIGVILVGHRNVGAFSNTHVDLLKTFADQAVIAIENVRLFTELQQKNDALTQAHARVTEALERQTATSEILRVISSSPTDVQPVFNAIVQSAGRLCDAAFGGLHLFDGERITFDAHYGISPEEVVLWPQVFPMEPDRGSGVGRAVVSRAIVHIEDIRSDPEYHVSVVLTREGYRTLLAVPMLRGDVVVGVIALWRREVRPFSETQIEMIQTFADQAVIAIENVRLFKELEARNRDLTTALAQQTGTADILRVISRSQTDVQPVFDAIVRSAVTLCNGFFGAVLRLDGDLVHVVAQQNYPAELLREVSPAPLTSGLASVRAIREDTIVHIPDVEGPGVNLEVLQLGRAAGLRSALAVPMHREARPLGSILVARRQPGPFSDEQVALLQTFADQAVIAIENVRLFKELEARNRDLTEALEQQTATSEVLKVISRSAFDLMPVLETVTETATRLCGAQHGHIFQFDGEMLRFARGYGTSPELRSYFNQHPVPLGPGSVSGRAGAERRPVHIHDVLAEPGYQFGEAARLEGWRTVLAVPMLREDALLGVIAIWKTRVEPFTDTQIALVETFADQAVIAIENVRLFKELEARNRDLTEALDHQTATAEILRVISSSPTDIQPVLDTVAESAARLCESFDAIIYRLEGDRLLQVAHHGPWLALRPVGFSLPLVRGTVGGRSVLDRRTVHVADVQTEVDEFPESRENARRYGFRTILSVPLTREGVPIGSIVLPRAEVRPFTDAQIALLQTFADQAVIAIENVRLFKELEARTAALTHSVNQLTALGEVGRAVSSTLELETVLNTIVERANQLAETDACSVYEYDEQAEAFQLRATNHLDDEVVALTRQTPIRKGEGVLGRMAISREPVQISDIAPGQAYHGPLRDVLLRTGTRALLAIPLLREDHLVGGLTVNRKAPGEFAPEVVELLKTFAAQSAIAIQHARLFRELEAQSRQLEIASRHKSDFLANVSHELRTPMNAILGFNEMILGDVYGEVPHDLKVPLTDIQNSGKHLLRLINNVLDLSKIEAGRMELALADYVVQDTVATVGTALRSLAIEKGLDFVTTVPEDIPLARGDAGRITQCLMNLAGNALKFTRQGRVEIAVELRGDVLQYRVADTGIGIARDQLETVFSEFRQGDPTIASEFGGTGLGLSITKKFVALHGGRIWVESELGTGSTFHFAIPLRVELATTA